MAADEDPFARSIREASERAAGITSSRPSTTSAAAAAEGAARDRGAGMVAPERPLHPRSMNTNMNKYSVSLQVGSMNDVSLQCDFDAASRQLYDRSTLDAVYGATRSAGAGAGPGLRVQSSTLPAPWTLLRAASGAVLSAAGGQGRPSTVAAPTLPGRPSLSLPPCIWCGLGRG